MRVVRVVPAGSGTCLTGPCTLQVQLRHLSGNEDPSFLHWTDDMFLSFCVLSGCDYLVRGCEGRVPGVPMVSVRCVAVRASPGDRDPGVPMGWVWDEAQGCDCPERWPRREVSSVWGHGCPADSRLHWTTPPPPPPLGPHR